MARTPLLPWPRTADDGTPLGIDVATKHTDIRKLTVAGFASSAAARGYDVEDVVQEVLLAVHRRNHFERSAFDPRRGTFGHYIHNVARCQLANLVATSHRHPLAEEDSPELVDEEGLDPLDRLEGMEDGFESCRAEAGVKPLWEVALEARRAAGPQLSLFSPSALAACAPLPEAPRLRPLRQTRPTHRAPRPRMAASAA